MRVFKISRKKWLKGEGHIKSYLLRPSDGKMCCVGQVAEQCGLKESRLVGKRGVGTLDTPALVRLENYEVVSIEHCKNLYSINDNPSKWKGKPARRMAALNKMLEHLGANWRMELVP